MKRIFFISFFLDIVFCVWAQEQKPLVVFLVRHCEKLDQGSDPELSFEGKERAETLVQTLKNTEIEFVHSTNLIRTKNTAAPIAQHFGLIVEFYDPYKLSLLAEKLKKSDVIHLVIGHSNTTPALVKLLGGQPRSEINEKEEYDRLYILTIKEYTETTLLRYGDIYKQENNN